MHHTNHQYNICPNASEITMKSMVNITTSNEYESLIICIRSWRLSCLVTWFCYHMIAKPGNKTGTPLWPDQYVLNNIVHLILPVTGPSLHPSVTKPNPTNSFHLILNSTHNLWKVPQIYYNLWVSKQTLTHIDGWRVTVSYQLTF